MTQKPLTYFGAGCILVVAVVLFLLGLTFMVGSAGKAWTLITGLIMLAIGLGAGYFTVRLLSKVVASSPDSVDERVLNLATLSDGEVTAGEVAGQLRIPVRDATASLERMVQQGHAEHKVRGDDLFYAFAGMTEARKVKRCTYCGTEFPIREPGLKCSSCGGNLEIVDAED